MTFTPLASWALVVLLLVVLPVAVGFLIAELHWRRAHTRDDIGRVCVCDRCMSERFEVTP